MPGQKNEFGQAERSIAGGTIVGKGRMDNDKDGNKVVRSKTSDAVLCKGARSVVMPSNVVASKTSETGRTVVISSRVVKLRPSERGRTVVMSRSVVSSRILESGSPERRLETSGTTEFKPRMLDSGMSVVISRSEVAFKRPDTGSKVVMFSRLDKSGSVVMPLSILDRSSGICVVWISAVSPKIDVMFSGILVVSAIGRPDVMLSGSDVGTLRVVGSGVIEGRTVPGTRLVKARARDVEGSTLLSGTTNWVSLVTAPNPAPQSVDPALFVPTSTADRCKGLTTVDELIGTSTAEVTPLSSPPEVDVAVPRRPRPALAFPCGD